MLRHYGRRHDDADREPGPSKNVSLEPSIIALAGNHVLHVCQVFIIPMLVGGCVLDVRLGLIALWVPLCQRNALGVHFLRVTLVSARSCRAGTYSAAGAQICTSCPAGKYSAAGAATCTSCPSGQGSLPGSSSCVKCNDQPWTWQKCNKNRCPKAANADSAGDCKCKKAHNWSRRKQKCVKK